MQVCAKLTGAGSPDKLGLDRARKHIRERTTKEGTIMDRSISMDDSPRSPAPVLRPDLLARIGALNFDYLELLAREHACGECAGQLPYFAPKLQPCFEHLSLEHRARLAATPYALYSLKFDDVRFWEAAACAANERQFAVRYRALSDASAQALFCETALVQAWHIAATHPLAARVLYSMSERVRARLAAAPLWRLRHIASEHQKLLSPRWPTNACFWPDLLSFAQAGDSVRLATTQLLGTQLIAGELMALDKYARARTR
jgi:hypothetical protein